MDYEYICAGIILLLILSITQISMSNLMTHQLARIEEEKGYTLAEKILDMLLLSPGTPSDWGDYASDPISLGLATQNSLEAYVLDASKVLRLTEDHAHYISPGKARSLLGLSKNYQFSLKITPVFIIAINSEGNGTYTLTVTSQNGSPLPNLNITGYYLPKSFVSNENVVKESTITGIDGRCTLNFQYEPNYVLIVCASQLGVKVMKTDPPDLYFILEGDCIVESETQSVQVIHYTTGSVYGLKQEAVFRYVEIGDFAYYVEFNLWS